jgi:hypothetical protein
MSTDPEPLRTRLEAIRTSARRGLCNIKQAIL